MPVCPLQLSEASRGRLATALLLLHFTIVLLAQLLYLLAMYLHQQLSQRALLLRGYSPDSLHKLLTSTVIMLAAFHLPSAKICQDMGYMNTR